MLAVLAGGRCEFLGCNAFLFEHHLTKTRGVFGEDAHIVAFAAGGARANAVSGSTEVHSIDNLMLLCRACHKLVDGDEQRFPEQLLAAYKEAHERRIHHLTGLGPELATTVVQFKAAFAGQPIGIPAPLVFEAVLPRFPADSRGFVIDLTQVESERSSFLTIAREQLRLKVRELLAPGVEPYEARHLSVFALAPIPLLFELGVLLGNKVVVEAYQRHRDTENWTWKKDRPPAKYRFHVKQSGDPSGKVALLLSLSGCIAHEHLEASIDALDHVYELTLDGAGPSPTFLQMREDLLAFAATYRDALATIRQAHPRLRELHVFPAVPAPVAITCGRELLPKVDPTLVVYDFDKTNGFQLRLKVNEYDPE